MAEHPALKAAAEKWGSHPMGWPVPPRKRPGFLDRHLFGGLAVMAEERLTEVFGPITDDMRSRFWSEPGQSPYEDAGGAMLRCYEAMLGLPVERLPTYAEVIDGLGARP
jgi:hypothetical protein